jgi:hypothetical protein
MFFVLWLVGLIVISIELWGPTGSVSANCNRLVFNNAPVSTDSNMVRLAWLQQKSICKLLCHKYTPFPRFRLWWLPSGPLIL